MDTSFNIVSSFQKVADSFTKSPPTGKDQSGHKYIVISKENTISAKDKGDSSKPKEAASFQEITKYVKALMEDKYSTKLNQAEKAQVLSSFEKIANQYKEKKMGFFTRLLGIQTRRFKEANKILENYSTNLNKISSGVKASPISEGSSSSDEIEVRVRFMDGKSRELNIPNKEKATVKDLIQVIAQREKMPEDSIRVIFNGKRLDPDRLLKDYKADERDNLHVIIKR